MAVSGHFHVRLRSDSHVRRQLVPAPGAAREVCRRAGRDRPAYKELAQANRKLAITETALDKPHRRFFGRADDKTTARARSWSEPVKCTPNGSAPTPPPQDPHPPTTVWINKPTEPDQRPALAT